MPKTATKNKKEPTKKRTAKKSPSKDQKEIAVLKKDLKGLNDRHLRLKAEFDYFRRRKTEEFSKLLLFDGENAIKGFLPIFDDLERMVKASKSSSDKNELSLADGIKMVSAKIEKYFETLDVKPYGNVGDTLDSDLHDAMLTKTDKTKDENIILDVFEKGFTYREKVIRHAKVIVNKK